MDLRSFLRAARLPALAFLVAALAACGDSQRGTPLAPDAPSLNEALNCGYIGSGGCASGTPPQAPGVDDCGYIGSGGCRVLPLEVAEPALNRSAEGSTK